MTERIQFNRLEAAREESRTRDRDVPSRVDSLDGLVGSRGSTPCRSVHYCDHCHSRRDRCRHRQNRSDVSCPRLAGPEDANENLAAKDETNEARGTQCENADRSGLGLHPRLAWAIGVMAIALSLVSRGWTGWGLYLSRFRPLATEAPFCSDYVVVALVPRQARPITGGHLTLSLRLLG